jgi:Ca2+-transporting ATPase
MNEPQIDKDSELIVDSPHASDVDALVSLLRSDRARGLSAAEASERLTKLGPNELAESPPVPAWKKLVGQFKELVIWILIVAAVISGAVGEWVDTAAILAIVLLNGIIGFLQEEKAERALAALQKLSAPMAKVIRDGTLQSVAARDLVPGDRIELEAGDNISADARLIEAFSFRVQEAALTGESVPVDKDPSGVLSKSAPIGDRRNMAYMGTVAASGKASAVVTGTAMNTELGHIAGLLNRYEAEPTPLQRRLAELGRVLVVVCLLIVGIIFVLELVRGGKVLEVFLTSVSLAVAAVPEGMPAVVTMALAVGLQRMVKRNALIRKLPSVETLGSVTMICSDKTGTLTRNEMTVREVMAGGKRYEISGVGYAPRGEFRRAGKTSSNGSADPAEQPVTDPRQEPDLRQTLIIAARCNNASMEKRGDGGESWQVIGDPTEGALLVLALKAGITRESDGLSVVHEIPFDSERKAMSVIVRAKDGKTVMYSKGAPEVILTKCASEQRDGNAVPLSDNRRNEIMQTASEMASRALRVLALAYREQPHSKSDEYQEKDLVFSGLAGMIDPPRDEAKDAVLMCRTAGIRPIMITGDHPETALAIARELNVATGDDRVVTGQELDSTSDDDLTRQVGGISVYARVSAEHKLRVVKAWKSHGQIVAMTGDGVNDAPAVKAADIGIAMGVTGTDVTKEASDMVLTDDNFASIVNAVEEGRGIFDNIQKFVHYLLSCNTGEVLFMFFAALIGWPVPLLPIHILWINLVTDGLPALALGMEPPERDIMRRPPRPPREPVITWRRGLLILINGCLVAIVAAIGFGIDYRAHPDDIGHARTVAFCIMAFSQLFLSFSCRSHHYTMPQLGLFTNLYLIGAVVISGLLQLSVVTLPFAKRIFETETHPEWRWEMVFLLSLTPVTIIEVFKLARAFYGRFFNQLATPA